MKIEILSQAEGDLISGHRFYEKQSPGLGSYFFNSLLSDIDSLRLYGGIHPIVFGLHRCLSRRFPFAIYYRVEGEIVSIRAVLDCRRNPASHERRLKKT